MAHFQLFDGFDQDAFAQSGDPAKALRISWDGNVDERIDWPGGGLFIRGTGLFFDPSDSQLVLGTVQQINIVGAYGSEMVSDLQVAAKTIGLIYAQPTPPMLEQSVIATGDDLIEVMGTTAPATDTTYQAHGWGGNDTMLGGGSQDTLWGGDGNDVIEARSGDGNYLRGEAGDDSIVGANGFDDINGNQGNDTISGGAGDDWVVGGKDNDVQTGDDGADIVWGNLGNDTLDGGAGNDQIRGGQGDDILTGGAGDDFVSGDRGNDTETGGAGADIFHSFSGAGIDRVLDFNPAEGDRVMLDPGTTFTLKQVGADTVVDMGNGDQVILVGVQLSTLKDGWIFEG